MPSKKLIVPSCLLEQLTIVSSKGATQKEILQVVLNLLLEESHRPTGGVYTREWVIGEHKLTIKYGSILP